MFFFIINNTIKNNNEEYQERLKTLSENTWFCLLVCFAWFIDVCYHHCWTSFIFTKIWTNLWTSKFTFMTSFVTVRPKIGLICAGLFTKLNNRAEWIETRYNAHPHVNEALFKCYVSWIPSFLPGQRLL